MKRTVEFVLGLIGGIFGIICGVAAMAIGGLGDAVGASGSSGVGGLGISAIILSVVGIVGAAIVSDKSKIGGWLMVIAAIGGTISISSFYILPGILLLIGGITALVRKDKTIIQAKE